MTPLENFIMWFAIYIIGSVIVIFKVHKINIREDIKRIDKYELAFMLSYAFFSWVAIFAYILYLLIKITKIEKLINYYDEKYIN